MRAMPPHPAPLHPAQANATAATHVAGGWTSAVSHEAATLYLSMSLVEQAATEDAEACHAKCVALKAACLAWAWCPKAQDAG